MGTALSWHAKVNWCWAFAGLGSQMPARRQFTSFGPQLQWTPHTSGFWHLYHSKNVIIIHHRLSPLAAGNKQRTNRAPFSLLVSSILCAIPKTSFNQGVPTLPPSVYCASSGTVFALWVLFGRSDPAFMHLCMTSDQGFLVRHPAAFAMLPMATRGCVQHMLQRAFGHTQVEVAYVKE